MVRLYYSHHINQNLQLGQEHSYHYLVRVHRLRVNDNFILFNQEDGEYVFKIEKIDREHIYCTKIEKIERYEQEQMVNIVIPTIKPSRLEWALEKLTEIGIGTIFLYNSERTLLREPDFLRLSRICCSALQQSNRIKLPKLIGPLKLEQILEKLDGNIILADLMGHNIYRFSPKKGKITLIIGPEGGFTHAEQQLLKKYPKMQLVNDGILRTETAAVAGLMLAKAHLLLE